MLVKLISLEKTKQQYGLNKSMMREINEIFEVEIVRMKNYDDYFYDNERSICYDKRDLEIVKKDTNALEELERFQTDRLLHKNPFDLRIATMNILEELYEAHGIGDNKERILADNTYRLMLANIEACKRLAKEDSGITIQEPTVEDQVDAFCDIQVFAGGEIGKLGYSNEQCLIEVGKEINSRTGEIINGKFEKFKTQEAMDKWYKADFSGCKLCI